MIDPIRDFFHRFRVFGIIAYGLSSDGNGGVLDIRGRNLQIQSVADHKAVIIKNHGFHGSGKDRIKLAVIDQKIIVPGSVLASDGNIESSVSAVRNIKAVSRTSQSVIIQILRKLHFGNRMKLQEVIGHRLEFFLVDRDRRIHSVQPYALPIIEGHIRISAGIAVIDGILKIQNLDLRAVKDRLDHLVLYLSKLHTGRRGLLYF